MIEETHDLNKNICENMKWGNYYFWPSLNLKRTFLWCLHSRIEETPVYDACFHELKKLLSNTFVGCNYRSNIIIWKVATHVLFSEKTYSLHPYIQGLMCFSSLLWLLIRLIVYEMYNMKIISLKTRFKYKFDGMLCVICCHILPYIIALTCGQC